MEGKKVTKISLSTFFLIFAIIVIIIMGIFMYKLYNERIETNERNAELETQVDKLNIVANNTQKEESTMENINSSSLNENINTTTTNNDNTTSNESNSFTDKQVKKCLSDFLELSSHANCDDLLQILTEKGNLNYNPSKDNILDDGLVITNIKFSDYKKAMLNYVSEDEFKKNWTSSQYFEKNKDGYLTKVQGGGNLRIYTIKSITKKSDLNYYAKTTSIVDDTDEAKENENFTFKVKSYNGKCVIDSIKSNN